MSERACSHEHTHARARVHTHTCTGDNGRKGTLSTKVSADNRKLIWSWPCTHTHTRKDTHLHTTHTHTPPAPPPHTHTDTDQVIGDTLCVGQGRGGGRRVVSRLHGEGEDTGVRLTVTKGAYVRCWHRLAGTWNDNNNNAVFNNNSLLAPVRGKFICGVRHYFILL